MSFLNDDQRGLLEDSPTWLAHSGVPTSSLVERIEAAIATFPEGVRARIAQRLVSEPDAVRTDLAALRLAGEAGARPVDASDDHFVLEADGQRFALDTLFWATPAHPAGRPEDLARLGEILDTTFRGRRYALYLRRPVPSAFDPAPVSRAVHLWLQAIDRGEWKGRHAIYEDDDVALELTLVGRGADGEEGRVMRVGPIDALERLESVDRAVSERAGRHRAESPELPLVIALGAQPRWRLPRGYVQQLLYGTAARTEAASGPEGFTYRATFRASGRALFADEALARVASLWWVEGAGDDPFGFEAWGNDNPWSDAARLPDLPVSRFLAAESTGEEKVLSWYNRPSREWRSA